MAPKGSIKGFYRQSKNGGGITKSKSPSSKKSSKHAASSGSNVVQPAALISHGSLDLKGDYDANENVLRQFDLDMSFGPCIGMDRLTRWERAYNLGLNPPKDIESLLRLNEVDSKCLWDGRV